MGTFMSDVYGSIRDGLRSDWRKAREHDEMKVCVHNLCYSLERALLVLGDDTQYSADDSLKRDVIADAKRFITHAKDRGFI